MARSPDRRANQVQTDFRGCRLRATVSVYFELLLEVALELLVRVLDHDFILSIGCGA